jgi:hypothetical protein
MMRAKSEEKDIEFFEAGEDSAEAFESSEEPLDFVALLVEGAVVFSGFDAVGLWRNGRDHAQAEHELLGLVTLVGAIQQQRQAFRSDGVVVDAPAFTQHAKLFDGGENLSVEELIPQLRVELSQ